jgi:two-component sensor histidine kinase
VFSAALLVSALSLGGVLAYLFGMLMTHPIDEATRAAHLVGRGEQVAALHSGLVEANVLTETLSNASAELTRRQEHATFLMRELAHRAKNQLAVVKGMAFQTARQSDSLDDFLEQFEHRLQGLAQSQDVLVRQNWKGAWLKELAQAQLEPFAPGDRVELTGPELFVGATAVQNIGFALHELATNASKHGALSTAEGHVALTWGRIDGDRIALDWIEHNGPAVTPPTRKGFGNRVIMQLVPHALEGSASLDFPPEGVRWHLEIPGSHARST